jgi:hypothetical protein
MSADLKRHAQLLKLIYKADPEATIQILQVADKKLYKILCEIAHNTLSGRVPLTEKEKKSLSKFAVQIRTIARRGEGWKKKKLRFIQAGSGFVTALLAPIITSVLASFLK